MSTSNVRKMPEKEVQKTEGRNFRRVPNPPVDIFDPDPPFPSLFFSFSFFFFFGKTDEERGGGGGRVQKR